MKKVYLGTDLRENNVYWELFNNNSLAITGLSGTGKSYLCNSVINIFIENKYEVIIISSKARVDFKKEVKKQKIPARRMIYSK